MNGLLRLGPLWAPGPILAPNKGGARHRRPPQLSLSMLHSDGTLQSIRLQELDQDNDGRFHMEELESALKNANLVVSPSFLSTIL